MTYRGFSLVEVLVGGAIAGVILIGNLHSLKFSMQAGAVSKSILNENDFKLTLSNAIRENCETNLMPKTPQITGTHKAKGIGQVSKLFLKGEGTDYENDPAIIKLSPETFKGDIEVVKMELKGDDSENTAGGGFFKRDFVAYYKKTNLGDLNTVAGKKCEKTGETSYDLSGCFTTQCKLDYEFGDDPKTDTTETGYFRSCKSLTCHPVVLQVAGSRFPCKWGELYRPGATPKCDKREKNVGNCDRPTDSKFLEGFDRDTTGRVNENGKCVCPKDGTRVLTAEGLCIKKQQAYNWFSCWPRTTENNQLDYDPTDVADENVGATEENIKNFCSNKYQGQEVCIRSIGKSGDGLNQSICKKLPEDFASERSYYKRVYNRETGQVSCLRFIQCRGNTNTSPPSAEWLIPQIQ